jgi:hypothetical protein
MINLRFHIVSIVAIFLALAIGMFAGSTLLDRATVEVLKGRQKSLDTRNADLRSENDRLRTALESQVPADEAFGTQVLPELLPDTIGERPVLLIAVRGIDEDVVRALQTSIRDAGGAPLGIVWLDARVDLDQPETADQVATALGIDAAKDKVKAAVVGELAQGLIAAASPVEDDSADSADPDLTTTTIEPSTPDPALDVLSRLVDADLLDWESPNEGEPGSRTLPTGGLDVVLLSGEGAELRPNQIVVPLVRALAARLTGVIVGEVRNPRTALEVIDQDGVPARGTFVDPLRDDDDLSGRLITVDDVDEPFGRLAVVLALGELPGLSTGSYGIAESASQPFPTPSG